MAAGGSPRAPPRPRPPVTGDDRRDDDALDPLSSTSVSDASAYVSPMLSPSRRIVIVHARSRNCCARTRCDSIRFVSFTMMIRFGLRSSPRGSPRRRRDARSRRRRRRFPAAVRVALCRRRNDPSIQTHPSVKHQSNHPQRARRSRSNRETETGTGREELILHWWFHCIALRIANCDARVAKRGRATLPLCDEDGSARGADLTPWFL